MISIGLIDVFTATRTHMFLGGTCIAVGPISFGDVLLLALLAVAGPRQRLILVEAESPLKLHLAGVAYVDDHLVADVVFLLQFRFLLFHISLADIFLLLSLLGEACCLL